ncbi:hypothetical protein AB0D08_10030 [Kitasatospora sp. NPDC048540]|uniref:SCO2583/SCO2584 N-terminal domain-containing protein n=1 Tax=Kitasatospora sp. NPDC048540 TaxID=3155634 RepID=UPI0033EA0F07
MPIADDPHPGPHDGPDPSSRDPFDGLVLDERFVRAAAVKEPSARTRMLSARWRTEEPVDPGGRRWSPGSEGPAAARRGRFRNWRSVVAVVVAVAAVLLALSAWPDGKAPAARPGAVTPGRPTRDVALPGGGTSDGSRCGAKGYHHFPQPAGSTAPGGPGATDRPGPQLVLGSYGFEKESGDDPGRFTIGLLLGPGGPAPLDLAAPLGAQGVAVEIEGPDGLVGGAYDLPVSVGDTVRRTPSGSLRIDPATGGTAQLTLPVEALCPGVDGLAVQQRLTAPTDSHRTITGPPPFTITVSITDPGIGALRRAAGSASAGDVLSADNQPAARTA